MLNDGKKTVSSLRALIVDDKDSGRRLMRSLLASIPDVEVIAEAQSLSEARTRIAELHPDLVLMDAEIQEGSGIDLMRGLESPTQAIFLATHAEFAARAFDFEAVDCLVKPVRPQRFVESVRRAKRRIAESRINSLAMRIAGAAADLSGGTQTWQTPATSQYPNQLTIRVRRRMFWLDVADIVWIQGASQYSRLHSRTGEFLLSRSLSSLACELDPKRFFRVHRSAIVNAGYVQEIRSTGDGRYNIYLHGGPILPMGRSRRELLSKLLESVARQT